MHYHGFKETLLDIDVGTGAVRARVSQEGKTLYELEAGDSKALLINLITTMMRDAGVYDGKHKSCPICSYIAYSMVDQINAVDILRSVSILEERAVKTPKSPMDELLSKVREDQASIEGLLRTGKKKE